MAVNGLPSLGGEYSKGGPDCGEYHVEVQDASNKESSKTGRPMVALDFIVKGDPNHAAKEGKRLTIFNVSLPDAQQDDADKIKMMKGMAKRNLFDPFGLEWPKTEKPFDPRVLVGKSAWVRVDEKKGDDGEFRPQVVAIAASLEKLPKKRIGSVTVTGAAGSAAGGSRKRR